MDTTYCKKLVHYFDSHYYDKFQWNIYTQFQYMRQMLQTDTVDIILIGEEMKEELWESDRKLLEGKLWAYLTEHESGLVEGEWYFQKYQRADQIYRDLLDIYAKKEHIHYEYQPIHSSKTAFVAFISASGGSGVSTIAAAAAIAFSQMEKVLYLNLEEIGSVRLTFTGESKVCFDELIYAIKSRRNTLQLKLESSVSRDETGTYYFKECANPMDLQTLSAEDIEELLKAVEASKVYDKVMIDLGSRLDEKAVMVMSMANRVAVITDQSEIAEVKLQRYLKYIQTVEEVRQADILSKMCIYFNKTLKGTRQPEQLSQIKVCGAFPLIENGNYRGIVDRISKMELLQELG
ncbi:MAG: hypothetical protein NC416_02200 [Eubacterium sp.]|nr:hypothetical protein [Eubacterium sp.]